MRAKRTRDYKGSRFPICKGSVGIAGASGPYPPVPNPVLWLRPDQGTIFQDTAGTITATANGDNVRRRNSLVGPGYVTSAAGPKLALNAINGYPAIRYDGTTTAGYPSANVSLPDSQSFTFYYSHKCTRRGSPPGFTGNGYLEIAGPGGAVNYMGILSCAHFSSAGGGGPGPNNDDNEVVTIISSPTGMIYRQNGVETWNRGTIISSSAITQISLGGFFDNGAWPFNGDEYEALLYNGVHGTSSLNAVESYLMNRYPTPTPSSTLALLVTDGNSLMAGAAATANSVEVPNQILTSLGATWDRVQWGTGGATTTNLIPRALTVIDPLFSAGHAKNLLVFWEISNDIVQNGLTGVQAYNNVVTYCTARKAAGWKVIVMDCLPRQNMTVTQDGYRVTANSSLATALNGATGNSIVFTPAGGTTWADALVQVSAIPALSDPTNMTYYADGTHITDAGYALVVPNVLYAVQLF